MPRRSLRRLAGSIVIEALLASLGVSAEVAEFRAGTASAGQTRVLVLEDRRGGRAVFTQADFAISRSIADLIAVRVLKAYDLDRTGLVLRGTGPSAATPEDVVTAIGVALGGLEAVTLRFGEGVVSVISAEGGCRASVEPDGRLSWEGCGGGVKVHSPIRAAFQIVEPEHGLQRRDEFPPAYPVQAVALGREVMILALGGAVPAGKFAASGRIVAAFANDSITFPEDARVYAAVRQVMARVRH